MKDIESKTIQIGEWIFEIKMLRALKVDNYGEPYSAIANCNINGDTIYVDGLLSKDGEELSKSDMMAFLGIAKKLGMDGISYHRYQDGESKNRDVSVKLLRDDDQPAMRLVK